MLQGFEFGGELSSEIEPNY